MRAGRGALRRLQGRAADRSPRLDRRGELERITRRFAYELIKRDLIHPSARMSPPPIWARASARWPGWPTNMARMNTTDIDSRACVTGKPLNAGGIAGPRRGNRPRCAVCGPRVLPEPGGCRQGRPLRRSRLASASIVQGLGNVGYHAAKFLSGGGRLQASIAIAERDGALIVNPAGLDVEAVKRAYRRPRAACATSRELQYTERVAGSRARRGVRYPDPGGDRGRDQPLQCRPDSSAPLIVEAANGPVTAGADAKRPARARRGDHA